MSQRAVIESLPAMQKFFISPLFVASLLICSSTFNLSADIPQIRVSVVVKGDDGDGPQMVSALSHELRKLDGVLVTDTQPALTIKCLILHQSTRSNVSVGYSASLVLIDADGRLMHHLIQTGTSIPSMAHELVTTLDGSDIEQMRRAAQP